MKDAEMPKEVAFTRLANAYAAVAGAGSSSPHVTQRNR